VNHGKALLFVGPFVLEKAFLFGIFFVRFFYSLEKGKFCEFLFVIIVEKMMKKVVKISKLMFVQRVLLHGLMEVIRGGLNIMN
jgi:hypothetical protein